ncbi:MAG: hypothetical protein ACLR4Z_01825 [Butyricicoccaceae bacterium]
MPRPMSPRQQLIPQLHIDCMVESEWLTHREYRGPLPCSSLRQCRTQSLCSA